MGYHCILGGGGVLCVGALGQIMRNIMKVKKTRVLAQISKEIAVIHFISPHLRDQSEVEKIATEIEEIGANYSFKVLVINFGRLRQVTSSLLGKLILIHRQMKKQKVKVRACCMGPEVERAYRICKLHKLIPLYATEEKAVHA
jgi:anti-anti-sigma factor